MIFSDKNIKLPEEFFRSKPPSCVFCLRIYAPLCNLSSICLISSIIGEKCKKNKKKAAKR